MRHSGWGWRAVEQTFAKMPRGSEVNKTTKVQKSCYIQSRSSIVCKRDHRCLHMRKIWIDENVAVNMSMSTCQGPQDWCSITDASVCVDIYNA